MIFFISVSQNVYVGPSTVVGTRTQYLHPFSSYPSLKVYGFILNLKKIQIGHCIILYFISLFLIFQILSNGIVCVRTGTGQELIAATMNLISTSGKYPGAYRKNCCQLCWGHKIEILIFFVDCFQIWNYFQVWKFIFVLFRVVRCKTLANNK